MLTQCVLLSLPFTTTLVCDLEERELCSVRVPISLGLASLDWTHTGAHHSPYQEGHRAHRETRYRSLLALLVMGGISALVSRHQTLYKDKRGAPHLYDPLAGTATRYEDFVSLMGREVRRHPAGSPARAQDWPSKAIPTSFRCHAPRHLPGTPHLDWRFTHHPGDPASRRRSAAKLAVTSSRRLSADLGCVGGY
jgi:hypothetical protein